MGEIVDFPIQQPKQEQPYYEAIAHSARQIGMDDLRKLASKYPASDGMGMLFRAILKEREGS